MPLETRELDDAVVLLASGRITIGSGDLMVREAVQAALDRGFRSIVIDLHEVRSLDSAGTGELVAAHLRLQALGGRLALTSLSPKVGGVLQATRLTEILNIHDDLDAALRDLGPQTHPGQTMPMGHLPGPAH